MIVDEREPLHITTDASRTITGIMSGATQGLTNTSEFNIILVKIDGRRLTLKPNKSCKVWVDSVGRIQKVRTIRVMS